MTCYQEITCPRCDSNNIMKAGRNAHGGQRYCCQEPDCPTKTFMLEYRYRAYEPGIKGQLVDMAINGSGVRDTARVLKIDKNTVINTLRKKAGGLVQVNPRIVELGASGGLDVMLEAGCDAELDGQWSYVGNKSNQRRLWYAVDHATNTVLAYMLGKRKGEVFQKPKALLGPFNTRRFYTDGWGAYERHLDAGKRNTQKIERKNLTTGHGLSALHGRPFASQNSN